MVLVLVSFLEILKQLVENGVAHLKSPLFSLAKKAVVFILELFALKSAAVEVDFFLITEMRSSLLLDCFLNDGRDCLRLVLDAIVVLAIVVNLLADSSTLPMLSIYSWSMRETRRWA
jgi:hypothetical protein